MKRFFILTLVSSVTINMAYSMNGLKTDLETLASYLQQLQKGLAQVTKVRLNPNLGLLYWPGKQPLTRTLAHLINELNGLIRNTSNQAIPGVVEIGENIPVKLTLISLNDWVQINDLATTIRQDLTDSFSQYPNNPNKIIVLLKAGQKDEYFDDDRKLAKKTLSSLTPHVFVFMLNNLQSKRSAAQWSPEERDELKNLAALFE